VTRTLWPPGTHQTALTHACLVHGGRVVGLPTFKPHSQHHSFLETSCANSTYKGVNSSNYE